MNINIKIKWEFEPFSVSYYNVSIIDNSKHCMALHVNSFYGFDECVEYITKWLKENGNK